MRAAEVMSRLEDRPFRPFRIQVSDGNIYDITEPGTVLVSMSSMIIPFRWGTDEDGTRVVSRWRTVALSHIVQFSDLDEGNGRRRRRRA